MNKFLQILSNISLPLITLICASFLLQTGHTDPIHTQTGNDPLCCKDGHVHQCVLKTFKVTCQKNPKEKNKFYEDNHCSCIKGIAVHKSNITLPKNAVLANNVVGFECKKGFVQVRDECIEVHIPDHATLNDDGHTFKCNHGFKKYRNICQKIELPAHSKLNKEGSDFICKEGYKRHRQSCIKK